MIEHLQPLVGRVIVVDTDTDYIYIGTLKVTTPGYLVLEKVDVHDHGAAAEGTKEKYVHESRKVGVRANRLRAAVRMDRVISISLLEEVIEF
jgi:hypothetical protein